MGGVDPVPHQYVSDAELPENWDWRNVGGRNYLSWTVNQHIPSYCGSCWAQGTLSALADRFQIAAGDRFPTLALSAQAIINCRAGGSCEGGNPAGVYEFAAKVGVPDVTCLIYEAKDGGPVEDCTKPDITSAGIARGRHQRLERSPTAGRRRTSPGILLRS